MVPYIIHASILLALFYSFYWLLLRKETFYQLNRFFLVSSLALALVLPLVSVPAFMSFHEPDMISQKSYPTPNVSSEEVSAGVSNEEESRTAAFPTIEEKELGESISATTEPESVLAAGSFLADLNVKSIVWYIYLIGITIFSLTFLIQLFVIFMKKSKLEYIQDGRIKIYELTDEASPFSFLNWIFINPASYDYDTYEQILEHEKIHVGQSHFIDKLLSEFLVIIFWFNPFAWLFRKIISHNLEFLTDYTMLNKGTERKSYQMNLLKVSVPDHSLSLTTNYNESFLKERFLMMNSKKSSAKSSWKYLLLLPIIGLSVSSLNAVIPSDSKEDQIEMKRLIPADNKAEEAIKEIEQNNDNINQLANLSQEDEKDNNDIINNHDTSVEHKSLSFTIEQGNDGKVKVDFENNNVTEVDIKNLLKDLAKDDTKIPTQEKEVKSTINIGIQTQSVDTDSGKLKPGEWQARTKSSKFCIQMNVSRNSSGNSLLSHCVRINEIQDFNEDGLFQGKIERDAGTLYLDGYFSNRKGNGTYEFEGNQTFINELNEEGFSSLDEDDLMILFFEDTDIALARMLKEWDNDANSSDFVDISIHGIDKPRFVELTKMFKNLDANSRNAKDLIEMQIHGVDINLLEAFVKAGYKDISVKEIVSASIHGIDAGYVEAIGDYGFNHVSIQDMVSMSIHGVSKNDMKEYKEMGLTNLSAEEMVDYAIHGVDPEFIADAQNSGMEDLDSDDMVSLSNHGTDASILDEFAKNGRNKMDPDDLVAMSIHGVTPEYLREFIEMGYEDIDPDDMVAMKIHGVKASEAKEWNRLGFDPSPDELVEFAIHGVRPSLYEAAYKSGFKNVDSDDMTAAKIHGVSPNYITDITALIGSDYDFDDLISAKIHGVSASFIKRVQKKINEDADLDDYTDMKIHGY